MQLVRLPGTAPCVIPRRPAPHLSLVSAMLLVVAPVADPDLRRVPLCSQSLDVGLDQSGNKALYCGGASGYVSPVRDERRKVESEHAIPNALNSERYSGFGGGCTMAFFVGNRRVCTQVAVLSADVGLIFWSAS